MPIHVPGQRDRRGRSKKASKRNIAAMLSLTAMVDMFTVLLVFLLQNYKEQNVYLKFYQDVQLPEASQIKELKPAHVITISKNELRLDEQVVATYRDVQASSVLIDKLYQPLAKMIAAEANPQKGVRGTIRDLVRGSDTKESDTKTGKITIQAEKSLDFGTVKKVMYTVSEAGGTQGMEMNFAVIRVDNTSGVTPPPGQVTK